MIYKILKLTFGLLLISMLTACDNDIFNQFFRNPYIVEIAELDKMDANKWYEFETEAKALNRDQEIVVSFDGSKAEELDFYLENEDSKPVYQSKKYLNQEVEIEIIVIGLNDKKYNLTPVGSSGGILLSDYGDTIPIGEIINTVRIKGNVDFNNVKVTWISRTGK